MLFHRFSLDTDSQTYVCNSITLPHYQAQIKSVAAIGSFDEREYGSNSGRRPSTLAQQWARWTG